MHVHQVTPKQEEKLLSKELNTLSLHSQRHPVELLGSEAKDNWCLHPFPIYTD